MADAEPLPGTARLAGWLGRTILTLVRGYSRPGDRVLLLAPLVAPPRPPSELIAGTANSYAGLTEAVWTVARLGRSIDTATASPPPDYHPGDASHSIAGDPDTRVVARPGRLGVRIPTDHNHDGLTHPALTGGCPGDTFDLIITAVHPQQAAWLVHTDWDALLSTAGILAVLTHSDRLGGRLHDVVSLVVRTVRNQYRGWLDHIAVLDQPLPPAARPDAHRTHSQDTPTSVARPLRAVHHDLLLFGPVHVDPIAPYERSRSDPHGGGVSSDE